ncbi:B- and T-lymphocyte attenuator-like isoform X1 [Xyrichtys novacula]|nr:B- and T-lymphocyte attenuator-like isoform X1 [Xyrichtys novacula]
MSSQMDRLIFTTLLILSCFTFVCVHGRSQDGFSSCEVALLVKRGTTWAAAPEQHLTVDCPVKHCGESLNVTWCKLSNTDRCEHINFAEHTGVEQNFRQEKDKIISYLTFERISIHDDGLYRCVLLSYKEDPISHIINISVSDSYSGVQNLQIPDAARRAADPKTVENIGDAFWLPYFYICISIALLAVVLTVLTFIKLCSWKRILTVTQTKGQEIATYAIPDLPKGSAPSISVLPVNFQVQNDSYQPAVRPASQAPPMTCGNQSAVVNTVEESQGSDHAVYAVVNRPKAEIPVRELHNHTAGNKNTEYASIKFRSSS